MFWYDMANKKQAYYFTPRSLPGGTVAFNYPLSGAKKRKTMIGKYLSLGKWHYAISAQPIFTPIIGYSLKSHIVFTADGFKPWQDKERMHSQRRAKGTLMFNEEWRDLFLAFLSGLKNSDGSIEIQLTDTFSLRMKSSPLCLESDFGYIEPTSKSRYNVLEQLETDQAVETESDGDE